MYKSKGAPDDGAGGRSGGDGGGRSGGAVGGQGENAGAHALEAALLEGLVNALICYILQSTAPDSTQERAVRGRVAMDCVEYFACRLKPYHRMRPAPQLVVRLINGETAARFLNEARILLVMLQEARLEVTEHYLDTNVDYRALIEAYDDIDRFIAQTVPDLTFVPLDTVNRATQSPPLKELDSIIATTERMVAVLTRIVN